MPTATITGHADRGTISDPPTRDTVYTRRLGPTPAMLERHISLEPTRAADDAEESTEEYRLARDLCLCQIRESTLRRLLFDSSAKIAQLQETIAYTYEISFM